MFESIGFSEMLLIAVIALIVLGPEKFPEYAKIFLRATRDLQGYIQGIREDLAKEVNPLKGEFDKLKRQDPEKLLDALMKTGDKEEKKPEQKNDGSNELVAGGGYGSGSDTPQSDADSHPYTESSSATATEAKPEPPAESAANPNGPGAEAVPAGDSATSAKNPDFHYAPPERMD